MKIYGLAVDEKAQSPVILLKDEARDLALPIWVGPVEAMAISLAINAVDTPRPMTHDLIGRVVEALGGRLARVEVVALREGTFYAELVLRVSGPGGALEDKRVDCRPSDAIALAARLGVPILVAEEVLETAGTRSLSAAREDFPEPEAPGGSAEASSGDDWGDELDRLSPDDLKYKM